MSTWGFCERSEQGVETAEHWFGWGGCSSMSTLAHSRSRCSREAPDDAGWVLAPDDAGWVLVDFTWMGCMSAIVGPNASLLKTLNRWWGWTVCKCLLLYLISHLVPKVWFVASLCCPAAFLPWVWNNWHPLRFANVASQTTESNMTITEFQVDIKKSILSPKKKKLNKKLHFLKLFWYAMSWHTLLLIIPVILPMNLALYTYELFQGTFNRITQVGGVYGFWRAALDYSLHPPGRVPANLKHCSFADKVDHGSPTEQWTMGPLPTWCPLCDWKGHAGNHIRGGANWWYRAAEVELRPRMVRSHVLEIALFTRQRTLLIVIF
jgi:hypothetical protein